jgi:hypothetical protein
MRKRKHEGFARLISAVYGIFRLLSLFLDWTHALAFRAPNYDSTATPYLHHQMPESTNGCWHLHLDARRHLGVDAGTAPSRHLLLDARATLGPGVQDDPVVQAERDGAIIPQFPHPGLWVPRPTGLLHSTADCYVGKGNP